MTSLLDLLEQLDFFVRNYCILYINFCRLKSVDIHFFCISIHIGWNR
ncbi:hypothetical protein MITSMUL_03591 [Mitsuokella multacida DSM 20544]|uniref:Uncharacterized protein n=1 Tax=Mitsuokella multacida DSM 20544 TaxID=500635 RepID=C9KK92_9FIRM|nr:hypothetical protein MITSMUL_03591 [Mitsuokella multacida DSM 20544]